MSHIGQCLGLMGETPSVPMSGRLDWAGPVEPEREAGSGTTGGDVGCGTTTSTLLELLTESGDRDRGISNDLMVALLEMAFEDSLGSRGRGLKSGLQAAVPFLS